MDRKLDEVLGEIEDKMPKLLVDVSGWKSLDIDYDQPRVERVYRQYGDYRIYLHRIHACAEGESLLHPHPWPSIVRVISGIYEMGIGSSSTNEPPPVVAKVTFNLSGGIYEMPHRDGWHYVRPLAGVSHSLMVAGPPWNRWAPSSNKPLKPLTLQAIGEILGVFYHYYAIGIMEVK